MYVFKVNVHLNIEESLKAAEEDIAVCMQQKKAEDGQVVQEDVKAKNSIAQGLLREEIDELKLIESDCNEDIKATSMYYSILAVSLFICIMFACREEAR